MLMATTSTSFLEGGLGNHLGGLTDAGVDDLHSRVPKGSGDHLCTSIVSVEARLGYKDPDSVNANLCHREVPPSEELRLHGVLVYEFYKDSAGGLGMNEGYHAGEALARRFIDEAGAACL